MSAEAVKESQKIEPFRKYVRLEIHAAIKNCIKQSIMMENGFEESVKIYEEELNFAIKKLKNCVSMAKDMVDSL